jgi:LmbE family N-acetylglucosaminyl deacetylase
VAIGEVVTEARRLATESEPAQGSAAGPPGPIPRLFFPVITGQAVARAMSEMQAAGLPSRLWSLAPGDFLASPADITASVDVSSVLDRKLAALRSHRSQLDEDHLFARLTPAIAAGFFGVEHFRCVDRRPGDPLCLGAVRARPGP